MNNNINHIHLITTGGTIDSKFFPPTESTKVREKSIIPDFLNQIIKPHFQITHRNISMLDSSEITDSIRDDIISEIKTCDANNILITHGTNTMSETLDYLSARIEKTDKTIILTGSMIPMDGFCPTDGGFNLGFAIAKFQVIEKGIYLAMNGKIFETEKVKKDFSLGRFEELR